MKQIASLALTALMMVGCTKKDSNGHIAITTGCNDYSNPQISIIDSCEYVNWGYGLAHKGNCKFCAERRKKELDNLTIKIWEGFE